MTFSLAVAVVQIVLYVKMVGISANGKRQSRTEFPNTEICLPFAQTVNRPVCPCKWW